MTTLNQFESVFKSADKAVYAYEALRFGHVLVVTDLEATDAATPTTRCRTASATPTG